MFLGTEFKQKWKTEEMKAFTEDDSVDVPNPEKALFWQFISVLLYEDNHRQSKHDEQHFDKDEVEGLREGDHISLVKADAGHPTIWAETSKKPFDPRGEVEEDEDVEESKGDEQKLSLLHPLHLVHLFRGVAQQAYSSSNSLSGECSQDEGIDGEDGLSDKEEWGDDQPEEPSKESKVGQTISHQSSVRTGLEKCIWDNNPPKV